MCYAGFLKLIISHSRPFKRCRRLFALLYRNLASTLSFLLFCAVTLHFHPKGSQFLTSQWITAPPEPLWRTLNPGRRSESKPQSALVHPSLSPRITASASPCQNESLDLSVNQTRGNLSI